MHQHFVPLPVLYIEFNGNLYIYARRNGLNVSHSTLHATFRTVSVRVRADGQRAVKLAVESVISSIRENFTEFIHFTHRRPWSLSGRRLKLTEQRGKSTRRQQPAHLLSPCTENCHKKRTLTFTDGPFATGMRTREEKARRSGHPKLLKTLY